MPTISESFNELVHYRDLLLMLTWRDIKLRYKQSAMGFFWAILMPLLIVGAGILVRLAFSMGGSGHTSLKDISSVALNYRLTRYHCGARFRESGSESPFAVGACSVDFGYTFDSGIRPVSFLRESF